MIGTIMSPIASPPARTLKINGGPPRKWPGQIFWIWGVMKIRAKKPNAIVGTPARTSRMGLTILRTRGLAYSLRKIADPRPIGIAKIRAQKVTLRVPTTIGKTPKLGGVKEGPQSV